MFRACRSALTAFAMISTFVLRTPVGAKRISHADYEEQTLCRRLLEVLGFGCALTASSVMASSSVAAQSISHVDFLPQKISPSGGMIYSVAEAADFHASFTYPRGLNAGLGGIAVTTAPYPLVPGVSTSLLVLFFSTFPPNYGVLLQGLATLHVDLPKSIADGSTLKLTLASQVAGTADDFTFGTTYTAVSHSQTITFSMSNIEMPRSGPLVLILGE